MNARVENIMNLKQLDSTQNGMIRLEGTNWLCPNEFTSHVEDETKGQGQRE